MTSTYDTLLRAMEIATARGWIIEHANRGFMWNRGESWVRVTQDDHRIVCDVRTITDPWPCEFLFREHTLVGCLPVVWSCYRTDPVMLESLIQCGDYQQTSRTTLEMAHDALAWPLFCKHLMNQFLIRYNDALADSILA